jgi:hypothetical protein
VLLGWPCDRPMQQTASAAPRTGSQPNAVLHEGSVAGFPRAAKGTGFYVVAGGNRPTYRFMSRASIRFGRAPRKRVSPVPKRASSSKLEIAGLNGDRGSISWNTQGSRTRFRPHHRLAAFGSLCCPDELLVILFKAASETLLRRLDDDRLPLRRPLSRHPIFRASRAAAERGPIERRRPERAEYGGSIGGRFLE